MITTRLGRFLDSSRRRAAYSFASAGLWMEHGPTMTTILSLVPERTSETAIREAEMTFFEFQLRGTSERRRAGEARGSICRSVVTGQPFVQ